MKMLALSLLLFNNVYADSLDLCDKALKSCEAYSYELQTYNTTLKSQEEELEDKLATLKNNTSPVVWLLIGVAATSALYTTISVTKGMR